MRQYLISTDTTADLTDDFVRENSIDIHTLFYAFGEQLYGPGNEMPVKEFYTRMRNGEMPTTMACNPEDVAKIFKKRVAEGYDILHIAFSSALSSSYNNCCIAAREVMEEYPESKIIVIDSLAASMGEGLPVGKVRVRKKSLLTLVSKIDELMGSYKDETDAIFIGHGDCLEDAEFVASKIREKYNHKIVINTICPTIGAHSGPGTLALFFMGESRI